jgi:serine/threonine protein kinase
MPKEGWVTKQGSGLLKKRKKVWLVVTATTLQTFEKPGKSGGPVFNLKDIVTTWNGAEGKYAYTIKITFNDGKLLQFCAESASDSKEWLESFAPAATAATAATPAKAASAPSASSKHKPGIEDFSIIRLLGRGETGRIFLVRSKFDHCLYAMKSLSKAQLAQADLVANSIAEKNLLLSNNSPFLVSAKCSFQTLDKIFMVMDYVPGGELFMRLKEEGTFEEARVKLYAAEIALALGALHSSNCIYRDLRPENVLVDADGHIKLTDFGLAKQNVGVGQTTQTFCGTPEYIAPEVLQQQPYTKDVDWWSFGILVFEMLIGIPPFYDENVSAMYQNILKAPIRFPVGKASDAAEAFVKALLDRNPATRLGNGATDVEAVKAHPFFTGLDWKAVTARTVKPRWVPTIKSDTDTSNFDDSITSEAAVLLLEDGAGVSAEAQREFGGFSFTGDVL